MLETFEKGGVMMYPLLLCSVIAVAIFFERLFALRRSNVLPRDFVDTIEDLIIREKIPEAVATCNKNGSAIANILIAGIKNFGARRELIKETIEEVGRREAANLSRYTEALSTISAVSPLLGLLGTVTGIIKVFDAVATGGLGDPSMLSAGISEALITTVTGLCIAIPALVAYKYLLARADRFVIQMEETSIKMTDLMKGPEN